jgi:hypothetical protein
MLHKAIPKINNWRDFFPIGSGWKKIDFEQRDKSHVGPERKEKHVVDLIKMVKRSVSLEKGQKQP